MTARLLTPIFLAVVASASAMEGTVVEGNKMVGGVGGIGPAWTRGEAEKPAGEKSMGSWTAAIYTEEQQKRLGVDEMGAPAAKASRFPAHWGEPPRAQTRDMRELPGGYGMGSSTLARWIQEKMDADAKGKIVPLVETEEPNGDATSEDVATSTKAVWSELVGVDGQAAAEIIRRERPDLRLVQTVDQHSMVT